MKFFKKFEQHNYNSLGHRNQPVKNNQWIGDQGHTYNSKEPAETLKDAEKILKDKAIDYDTKIESKDGWIVFRKDVSWTNYQVGIDPKTNKPYNGSMSVASYNEHEKQLWTEPSDMIKDYTSKPHISEARKIFQDTPNGNAYLDFKKWAYKNRSKIKAKLSKISDGTQFFVSLRGIWMDWAENNAKEWSYTHSTGVAKKDFGRALAVMLKNDDLIIKRSTNKLLDLK